MDNSLLIKYLIVRVLLSQVLLDYNASQSKLQQRRANLEYQQRHKSSRFYETEIDDFGFLTHYLEDS